MCQCPSLLLFPGVSPLLWMALKIISGAELLIQIVGPFSIPSVSGSPSVSLSGDSSKVISPETSSSRLLNKSPRPL